MSVAIEPAGGQELEPAPARVPAAAVDAAEGLSRPQKAAAVVMTLGPERADAVLGRLSEEEVERLTAEIVELGSVEPDELTGVLSELLHEAKARRLLLTGGEDHARRLLRAWRGDEGDAIVDRLLAESKIEPFSFLAAQPSDAIARELREEQPQVAAVVLSHLPSRLAAAVLADLPDPLRADVAIRVATTPGPPRAVVERMDATLRARMGDSARSSSSRADDGLRELANMLNSTDQSVGNAVLEAIEQTNADLAGLIRAQMFIFDDLVSLTDRDLQEVLRDLDSQQLTLAMKGLEGELADMIKRNMSERARTALIEELELLGPVRRADIEAARGEIAAYVRDLIDKGDITVMGAGGDVVA